MARKLDQILIVDVESTCLDGPLPDSEESEIIEIGLCVTHSNDKTLFAGSTGLDHEVGLDDACQRIRLPMEGIHHRRDASVVTAAGRSR